MLKLLNIYQKNIKEFDDELINLTFVESVQPLRNSDKNSVPMGTKSILCYEDSIKFCSQSIQEIAAMCNPH